MTTTFTVDASTCMTIAGADWYPRRVIATGNVHWFYGPRLRNGVAQAAKWCSTTLSGGFSQFELSENLTGGTPCPVCAAKWGMT